MYDVFEFNEHRKSYLLALQTSTFLDLLVNKTQSHTES
jgi:hypothetical protein